MRQRRESTGLGTLKAAKIDSSRVQIAVGDRCGASTSRKLLGPAIGVHPANELLLDGLG
jgi:hypothetical protein